LVCQVQDEKARFAQVLQEVCTQVRIAANTPAVVLTNVSYSSESVKEHVSAMTTDRHSQALAEALSAQSGAKLPEKVPKIEAVEQLLLRVRNRYVQS
jgi:hypothetical protein